MPDADVYLRQLYGITGSVRVGHHTLMHCGTLNGRCDGIVLPGILPCRIYLSDDRIFRWSIIVRGSIGKGACVRITREIWCRRQGWSLWLSWHLFWQRKLMDLQQMQGRISGKRFLVIVLLFLPYTYAIFKFFASLIKKNRQMDGTDWLIFCVVLAPFRAFCCGLIWAIIAGRSYMSLYITCYCC